jgi:CheY-like chemotaxis protein
LLAFSRKQVMEKGNLCLASVIGNIWAMLTRLIPENITLHVAHTADQLTIFGDRCNIEQVLLNLVVNARDAMPKGGDIFVSTEVATVDRAHLRRSSEARLGKFAHLQVRDTGEGMDESVLRQIFEPFFTTKEIGKGTGMGLATVHGIVKQHDGWIEVISAPGAGTTFSVYFPLTASSVNFPAPRRQSSVGQLDKHTVLLVEDDSDVRALARHILEEASLEVLEAPDGPSALERWRERAGEIDLLITDMVMPGGLSGVDLADRIHAECPDLPVIFSSGYSVTLFNDDRNFRKDVNYLPKPFLAYELIAIVSTALAGSTGKVSPQVSAA